MKLPFLTNERLSRLAVSLMLCMGLLLPLMLTFGASGALASAAVTAAVITVVLTAAGSFRHGRIILSVLLGVAAAAQLVLPGMGFFGSAFEAAKAIALYFSEVPAAAPLYAGEIALTLGVLLSVVSYAFSSRSVGFLPATVLVVMMLFGMWSVGQAEYLWYAAPALAALLLLVSQTSHEKTNLFEVLPMALTVVVLSLLILPAAHVTLDPLYSAAMRLKQAITDHLFFTDPRNVFSLGAYGYYPMGNGRLGGEAEPSDAPVMIVKTDNRVLLRAVSKDEYTGRSWRDNSSGKRYLYVSPRWRGLRDGVFLESLPASAVRGASALLDEKAVAVQMQNTATSTVFTPAYLRRFSSQSDLVAYFNDSGELFVTRDLERGDRYTVFAPVLEGGDSALGALVEAAPGGSDRYYQDALERYTALPEHLESKVFEDLRNIVASASTPYEKACAIQRHLKRYYRYTLEPETPPENQDFVTYFLYVGREGYCTYFASAMTVLSRMAGLPARYVEGFIAEPSADGFAYVTGLEGHAWTEVYFEGFGWVPFDATPTDQNDQQEPPPQLESPQPTPTPPPPEEEEQEEPTPTPPPQPEDNERTADEDPPPFPWWLLMLAAVIAAGVRIWLRMPGRVAARQNALLDRIFVYGSACFALMKIAKCTPHPGETPLMFARRVDRFKAVPATITPLWRVMALSNYSRLGPAEEHAAMARSTYAALFGGSSLWVKLCFVCWAAFGRGCYSCLDTQMPHTPAPEPKIKTTAKPAKPAAPQKAEKAAVSEPAAAPAAPRRRRSDRNKEGS